MSVSAPAQVIVSPQDLHVYLERLRNPVVAGSPAAANPVEEEDAVAVGEIEAVLAAHGAVRQAVVLAKHDRPGTTRLMAYVVYDPGEQVTVSELRRFLRDKLPESMVPQHFVELDALPLSAEGRVDRGALPDPFAPADDHVAPRTATERLIAEIWRDLLGVDRVGIHDNFLDVGGHSLLAMRVIARVAKKVGVRINPSMLNLQTLEQIAAECDIKIAAAAPVAGAAASAPEATPVAAPGDGSPQRLSQRLFNAVKQTVTRT
jgi:acyl carrier protein